MEEAVPLLVPIAVLAAGVGETACGSGTAGLVGDSGDVDADAAALAMVSPAGCGASRLSTAVAEW